MNSIAATAALLLLLAVHAASVLCLVDIRRPASLGDGTLQRSNFDANGFDSQQQQQQLFKQLSELMNLQPAQQLQLQRRQFNDEPTARGFATASEPQSTANSQSLSNDLRASFQPTTTTTTTAGTTSQVPPSNEPPTKQQHTQPTHDNAPQFNDTVAMIQLQTHATQPPAVAAHDYISAPTAYTLNAGDEYITAADATTELPTLLSSFAQSSSAADATALSTSIVVETTTASVGAEYYFSASESEAATKPSHIWWALGVGEAYELANNLTRQDYLAFCSKSRLLVSSKQRLLCKQHYKVIAIVARGIKMAIGECQERFQFSRWNCSLLPALNERQLLKQLWLEVNEPQAAAVSKQQADVAPTKPLIFGEVMNYSNREKSFLNALIASGIAHAITKACSAGELDDECSCDKRIKSSNTKGKIEWVGCSDDIDFGAKFSRDFTDSADVGTEPASMISAHNYEVGRKIFKMSTDITCNCQTRDTNSLCTTNRCWRHLSSFKDIGEELIKRYERATHVQPSSKKPRDPKAPVKLRPVRRGVRKPRRKDLVYIDDSPDYCSMDAKLGVPGTKNRACNSTSVGTDNCNLLCCGRGYQTVVDEFEEDCECKFVWCCEVKCKKCRTQTITEVCN